MSAATVLMIKAASKRVVGRLIGLMRQKEHETLPTFFMNFDLFISPPRRKGAVSKKRFSYVEYCTIVLIFYHIFYRTIHKLYCKITICVCRRELTCWARSTLKKFGSYIFYQMTHFMAFLDSSHQAGSNCCFKILIIPIFDQVRRHKRKTNFRGPEVGT